MKNSDNLVTLVRRKYVLEEVVITREEYENYNKRVKDDFYWSELNFKNAEWKDLEEENTYYSAYEGDITNNTDDIVTFIHPDPEQRWEGETLPLLNSDD